MGAYRGLIDGHLRMLNSLFKRVFRNEEILGIQSIMWERSPDLDYRHREMPPTPGDILHIRIPST